MMHEHEKSDSAIVAAKPTNKAEQSAAEPAEPRAETKGNAGQQSTRRAQDRGSVSQALDRVRQAARQRKKEKFTVALPPCHPAMLRTAFFALKRDAAPGVDGVTWEDLRDGPRSQDRGFARSGQQRSVSGASRPVGDIFRRRTETTPARGRRSRRQNRPEGDGCGAERDLRGRLPRVLVWVPAQTQPA